MNTALAQHDETGRTLEWPMDMPLPSGYSWIVGACLASVVKVPSKQTVSDEQIQWAMIKILQHPELLAERDALEERLQNALQERDKMREERDIAVENQYKQIARTELAEGAENLEVLARALSERDALAKRLIEIDEVRCQDDGTLYWEGNGKPIV